MEGCSDIHLGRIVLLEGLQSPTGKKINGKYAMVLSSKENEDGRWECKVLHRDKTVGIKSNFMKRIWKWPCTN